MTPEDKEAVESFISSIGYKKVREIKEGTFLSQGPIGISVSNGVATLWETPNA